MRMRLHVLNFNIDCLEGSTLSLPIFQQCYNRTANDSNQTNTVSTREGPRRALRGTRSVGSRRTFHLPADGSG
jgi:hypothetical protein